MRRALRWLNQRLVQISAVLAVTALILGGMAIERTNDEAQARVEAACKSGQQLRTGVDRVAQRLVSIDGQDGSVDPRTSRLAADIRSLAEKPSPTCTEARN